jgi:outer membrane murein-binding lipoprotein Lpp
VQVNKNLEEKWNTLNSNYTSLEQRFQTLTTELKDSREEIDTLHSNLTEAKTKLDNALKLRDQAQDDLARCQKNLSDLKMVLGDLRKKHVELASKNQQLQFTLNAVQEQIKIPIADFLTKVPNIQGAVVGVSSKHPIVIINVGEDDGVHIGFQFTVFRGREYVGKIVIEKVYPNQAAGRILEMYLKDKILVGDKVATKVH